MGYPSRERTRIGQIDQATQKAPPTSRVKLNRQADVQNSPDQFLPPASPLASTSAEHTGIVLAQQYGNQKFQHVVAARRDEAGDTIRRYMSGEHSQFGAKKGEKETIIDIKGVKFTYGEVIALGDLFKDPDAIQKAPKDKLQTLQKLIHEEQLFYEQKPGGRKPTSKEWDDATGGQYLDLAADNTIHFSGENLQTWEKYHRQALKLARKGKMDEARLTNAFGDHFLTDAFAAGHLIAKKPVMKQAEKNVEKGTNSADFAKAVATRMLASVKGNDLMRYEVNPHVFRTKWEPMSVSALAEVIEIIRKHKSDEYFSTFAKMVHDRLNEDIIGQYGGVPGIEVENDRGDKWRLPGDETLDKSPKTLQLVQETVAQSRRNLELVQSQKDLKFDQVVSYVLAYVPRPTTAGQKQIDDATNTLTDPTQAGTVDRFVWITIHPDNYDLLIQKLIENKLLRLKAK